MHSMGQPAVSSVPHYSHADSSPTPAPTLAHPYYFQAAAADVTHPSCIDQHHSSNISSLIKSVSNLKHAAIGHKRGWAVSEAGPVGAELIGRVVHLHAILIDTERGAAEVVFVTALPEGAVGGAALHTAQCTHQFNKYHYIFHSVRGLAKGTSIRATDWPICRA